MLDYVQHGDASSAFSKLSDFRNDEFPSLFDDCFEWYESRNEYTFLFLWNLSAMA